MNILFLFLSHYIADFVFQSRKMGENKSTSFKWLVMHVIVYGATMGILTAPLFSNFDLYLIWFGVNVFLHLGTDFITSKLSGYFYQKKNMRMFWNVIGIDQTIHFLTLYYSYQHING